ncbi:MAG: type II secretion system major pseudopilin GspG, partial [Pseudomonadota bacterium]
PNVFGALSQANVKKASADLKSLRSAVEMYRIDMQSLPPAQAGLQALVQQPQGLRRPERYRPGGYIDALPSDPWGNPYILLTPGTDGRDFDIISYGQDGRPGGNGLDADLFHWQE